MLMEQHDDILLDVRNLTVAFGGREVVEGVSYTLRRGRTLGIVGESGSGKSVSTLALMGLLPRQATVTGEALLAGAADQRVATDLLSLDEEGFRGIRGQRISMIFQEPMTSLNPVQRCGAQVLEMLRPQPSVGKAERRERVLELFREVLLPRPEKIFDSYPHELSGGQKQRVMIAMALINNPDIIIADEPTTALDVTVQKTILELLRTLQQKYGISIIFISHDLGVIGQVADDIMVMYRGHMVEQGAVADILSHPQQPYTRGLLACRPPLDSRPHRLPTVEDYMAGSEVAAVKGSESGVNGTIDPASHNACNTGGNDHCPSHSPLTPTSLPSHSPLITVNNISVTYTLRRSLFGRPLETLQAVDGLTFDIREGETLGLVGESGCGKTTLGRALLRLIETSSGTVSYRGRPLDKLSSHEMRTLRPRLQIIFQDPYSSLNPRLTIGEAIREPLRVHRMEGGKERVVELMQQVGLRAEWYNRYPHELSGGQRQRVCIARALILRPELVVCDESVSALDVSVQAQVINLLNDLKQRYHYTYLFITHDLAVAHYISDRIMVMQRGRIVESGTADEVFSHPQTEYTRTLLDAIPRIR